MFSLNHLTLVLVVSTHYLPSPISGVQLRNCNRDNGVLKYEADKTYTYAYESTTWMGHGQRQNEISPLPPMKVNANALLTPLSDCEFVLTLDDATLTPPSNAESGKLISIPKSSIRFTMESGIVEETFVDPNEASWTVNIKKAIVSMIMNRAYSPQMDKTTEIERGIHGNCLTEFSESDNTYIKIVELSECGEGEGSALISMGVPYDMPLVKNKNIFAAFRQRQMKCEQKLEDGILSQGLCELKRPEEGPGIGNGHSSANLYDMEATLTYTSTTSGNNVKDEELETLQLPSTIMYNFTVTSTPEMQTNAENEIQNLLNSLSSDSSNKAKIFIDLKKAIGRVSVLPDVSSLEEIHRDVFYDAVAEVTSDEGVVLLADLVTKGQLDAQAQLTFYTNIPFATKPGTKSLAALTKVVSSISTTTEAPSMRDPEYDAYVQNATLRQLLLLGASGLAHQYCQMSNPSCGADPNYIALVDEIAKHVDVEGQAMLTRPALHALGNLDSLTPNAVSTLHSLLIQTYDSASVWVQILALDAFRRDPCQATLKGDARDILTDSTRTLEIRIHAYLAISKCLQSEDYTAIQAIFQQESDDGMGAFIGSHVRNIMDSSSPSKILLKERLYGIGIPSDVPSVHKKPRTSKFIEHSSFNQKENYGFSVDGFMIFVPQNPKPRFVTINVTVDVLGRSFNFLEVGLSNRLARETRIQYSDEEEAHWHSLIQASQSDDSYYRIFGTTVGIGFDELHKSMQMAIQKFMPGGEEGAIVDFVEPDTYMDAELTYPTLTGLPLTYSLQAVAFQSLKVKVTGAGDMMNMLMDFASSDLDLKANILLDAVTTVRGFVGIGHNTPYHMGYQLEGTMDDNQNFEIEGIKKEENKLEVKISFPRQIISSKTYNLNSSTFEEINGVLSDTSDWFNKISTGNTELSLTDRSCVHENVILGLKFCTQITEQPVKRSTATNFQQVMAFTVEKENPEMEGYDIQIIRQVTGSGNELSTVFEVIGTTPGSNVDRHFKLTYRTDDSKAPEDPPPASFDVWKKNLEIEAEVSGKKYSLNLNYKLELPIDSADVPAVSFKVDYATPHKQSTELLNVKAEAHRRRTDVNLQFGGPLTSTLGNIKFNMESGYTLDAEGNFLKDTFESGLSIKSKRMDASIAYSMSTSNKDALAIVKATHFGRSYEADVKFNRDQVYKELKLSFSDGNEEEDPYSGRAFYKAEETLMLEGTFKMDGKIKKEVQIDYGMKSYPGTLESVSFGLVAHRPSSKHGPYKFNVSSYYSPEVTNASLSTHHWNHDQLKFAFQCLHSSGAKPVIEFEGFVHSVGKVEGNASLSSEAETIVHLVIQDIPHDLTITLDSDTKDDGAKFNQKSKTVVDFGRLDKIVTTDSFTVHDRINRTVTLVSKTTNKEGEVLSKVDMAGQYAVDLLNGKSWADMTIAVGSTKVFKVSLLEIAAWNNVVLNSQFEIKLINPDKPKPYKFNWNLVSDNSIKSPDLHDWELYISNEKKLIWENYEFELVKDTNMSKKKGMDSYALQEFTNTTINGDQVSQTEAQVWLNVGPDHGEFGISGFSQTKENKDDFKLLALANGKPETLLTQNITFSLDRTVLATGQLDHLVVGSINKTIRFPNLKDFESIEMGHLLLNSSRAVDWTQVIRFHEKELTLYKTIRQEVNGKEESESNFLLDVSAKVVDENHQSKISVKSHHAVGAVESPISNFNFTLSK